MSHSPALFIFVHLRYLVQEYVDGGAVMDERELALGVEPLDVETAWSIFRDMLNGLECVVFSRTVYLRMYMESCWSSALAVP